MHRATRRSGLILLVVLGMLTLFSMLAITYVVFSSQSRSANIAMARREFRGTPPAKMFDEASLQLLRSTTDVNSIMWRQGLLGDLYGSGDLVAAGTSSDGPIVTFARASVAGSPPRRDNPARTARVLWSLTFPMRAGQTGDTALEAPRIIGGTFLKIPLQWQGPPSNPFIAFPEQNDVLNGRIVTFLGGPLAGESFRIVRYFGEMPEGDAAAARPQQSLQYSILIDLARVVNKSVTIGGVSQTVSEWIANSHFGEQLCYATTVVGSPLADPYAILINSAARNAYGSGIAADADLLDSSSVATAQSSGVAPGIQFLSHVAGPAGQLPDAATAPIYRSIATALLQNYAYTKSANSGFFPSGDLDESYDAADPSDFHLAFRGPGATTGDDIIPSFHRPAVINAVYSAIVNDRGGLSSFTIDDLFATIELLQRASGRPLSFRIQNVPPAYRVVAANPNIYQNPDFSGSNQGAFSSDPAVGVRTPQLDINWTDWTTGTTEHTAFENWVRWLQRGPWDVDTDGDGVEDSNWVDINLPLMTSPEGKLLKVMAAYYVEDLGGRLSLNANGNAAQTDITYGFTSTDPSRYAFISASNQLPQGLGFGTADISLRHLFSSIENYQRFVAERNGASLATPVANLPAFRAGRSDYLASSGLYGQNNDPHSALKERHRLAGFNQNRLPGLPSSVFGRTGFGIDLFGNPLNYETSQLNQIVDDPYEARQLGTPHRDRPITFAEWERLERMYDTDHSSLPRRLQRLFFPTATGSIPAQREHVRSVTPHSAATVSASFGATYEQMVLDPTVLPPTAPSYGMVERRVGSFAELVEALAQAKAASTPGLSYTLSGTRRTFFTGDSLAQLFPIEFSQNLPLDLNRPFGNGLDDDGDFLVDEPDEIFFGGRYAEYHNRVYNPATVGAANAIAEQYALGANGTGNGVLDPFYEDSSRTAYETNTFGGNQGRQLLARHLYCLAQLLLPDDYIFPNQADVSTPHAYGSAERARILAQWAVNVVDYRDADGSMTRFAYDEDPLTEASPGIFWEPTDGVVWGREQSELLMTETMAFHDMRISEKQNPPPGTNRWQQLRLPEGSLFLEFLCTASSDGGSGLLQGQPRGNLYRLNSTTGSLELNVAAISPADASGARFPVWRVILLEPQPSGSGDTAAEQYANSATRQQMQYQLARDAGLDWQTGGSSTPPDVSRVMWFSNLTPTVDNIALPGVTWPDPARKVYRNRVGSGLFVEGGQYLTVGPRNVTYVGQREQSNTPPFHRPNPHRIELYNNWVQFWDEENQAGLWIPSNRPPEVPGAEAVPTPSNYVGGGVTMVASSIIPSSWDPMVFGAYEVGLNISEPTPDNYYDEPTERLNGSTAGPNTTPDSVTNAPGFGSMLPDAYVDLDANPMGNSPHDPLDLQSGMPLADGGWQTQPATDERPNVESRENWSTALLQRLANPDRPWHATLNPYITVDWMSIDLTVFTGEDSIAADGDIHFASRQKSGASIEPTENLAGMPLNDAALRTRAGRTHFSYHTEEPARTTPLSSTATEPGYFTYNAPLEYIDVVGTADTSVPRLTGSPLENVGDFVTLGYLNSRFGLRGMNGETTHAQYTNAIVYYSGGNPVSPSAPATLNRDFVSSHELLNVPFSSPGQLLQDYSPIPGSAFGFNHLLDFDMEGGSPNAMSSSKVASALMELTTTRDPWIDSEHVIEPSDTVDPSPSTPLDNVLNNAMAIYRPPFNRLSQFTQAGRINLNTASQPEVWRGIMWSAITPAAMRESGAVPFQSELATSRSDLTASSAMLSGAHPTLDENFATRFPGIFRSGLGPQLDHLGSSMAPDNASSHGIMRLDAAGTSRLFNADGLYNPTAGASVPHNPLMQSYPITRLTNLTASNSDVYAVRIVLGYFEFNPSTGLGREYGEDEGKSKRHRAFYVIDRSIPVGYAPGADNNVRNTIIVRRMLD